ncbi:MAG: hypothetical protein CL878_03100 [Dehalococcoidia bacterium]|nr:hypothetical protein [Dehalococcoidia bacterium]
MLALCLPHLSPMQQTVFFGYYRAFAKRGLYIAFHPVVGRGPYLFGDGSPIADKSPHCFWVCDDRVDIHPDADSCAWVWHHGPSRTVVESDQRVIIIPRNDLFELRGAENTRAGWAEYRSLISVPWEQKRHELHFVGHCTGPQSAANLRIRACVLLNASGLPAHVGLLPDYVPRHLAGLVPLLEQEPLHTMGQYRFVLSPWGNYPFNPRLFRGLEAGSLVFHQASPSIQLLEDGILIPGQHYVELKPDLSDMLEKVSYYMDHPAEAREIAQAGHEVWMQNLFAEEPYTIPDTLWERFVSQPRWAECRAALDVHW